MGTLMIASDVANKYITDHPETSLTRNAIKQLLRNGCISLLQVGTRRYYNYEAFCEYLERGNSPPLDTPNITSFPQIERGHA